MRETSGTLLMVTLQLALGCSEAVDLGRRCPRDASTCSTSADGAAPTDGRALTPPTTAAAIGDASPRVATQKPDAAQDPAEVTADVLGIEPGSREQFCKGRGPALRVLRRSGTPPSSTCSTSVGRRLFAYALCSCSDVKMLNYGYVSTDSFDSSVSPFTPTTAQTGAAVGINGLLINQTKAATSIRGTLIIAGQGSIQLDGMIDVGGDLKTNATLELASSMFTFARDLWVNADIHGTSATHIPGNVYQTPGRTGAQALRVGGSVHTRDFVVPQPCACGADAALNIEAVMDNARATNANVELGVSPSELSAMLGAGVVPDGLSCGRFALDGVSLPNDTLTKLSGRVALFVDGDLTLSGAFASALDPDAELDVFVRGNLVIAGATDDAAGFSFSGAANIGMPERPAAVRLYVAGTGPMYINDSISYAAQLYAPRAALRIASIVTSTTYGAIFAGSFDQEAFTLIHYDRAILDAGGDCQGAPPPACASSKQCPAAQACTSGTCGVCTDDSDCGEPLACTNGSCGPLLL